MRFVVTSAALVLTLSFGATAGASCTQPMPPSAPYGKPEVPACLFGYTQSGAHSCQEWELQLFTEKIETYLLKLRAYTDAVTAYQNEAKAFVECEGDALMKEIGR